MDARDGRPWPVFARVSCRPRCDVSVLCSALAPLGLYDGGSAARGGFLIAKRKVDRQVGRKTRDRGGGAWTAVATGRKLSRRGWPLGSWTSRWDADGEARAHRRRERGDAYEPAVGPGVWDLGERRKTDAEGPLPFPSGLGPKSDSHFLLNVRDPRTYPSPPARDAVAIEMAGVNGFRFLLVDVGPLLKSCRQEFELAPSLSGPLEKFSV